MIARSNGDFEYTRGPRGSNGVFYPDKSSLRLGDNSGHAYVEGDTFSVPGGDPETTGSSEITQEGFPRRTVGLSQNFRRPAAVGPLQESARSEVMKAFENLQSSRNTEALSCIEQFSALLVVGLRNKSHRTIFTLHSTSVLRDELARLSRPNSEHIRI